MNKNSAYFKPSMLKHLEIIGKNIEKQKGVFTVLLTLSIHKTLHPNQDIRYHQSNMAGGFSGRSVDTSYITPTLKELELPSMSESGWLTRSLEQPYPYDKNYNGKVGNNEVKRAFLEVVEIINTSNKPQDVSMYILNELINVREKNKIELKPLENPESLTIDKLIIIFERYMNSSYQISGGSKIPVILFYSTYQVLIQELSRYKNCYLGELGFHTTSDKTSNSSGDIEVFKDGSVMESLEIKFNIPISAHIVNRAISKIIKHNPKRYYILSTLPLVDTEEDKIQQKVKSLHNEHGCQLIINGIIPTIKYYLRLVEDVNKVFDKFTTNIIKDSELKLVHKQEWKKIYENI